MLKGLKVHERTARSVQVRGKGGGGGKDGRQAKLGLGVGAAAGAALGSALCSWGASDISAQREGWSGDSTRQMSSPDGNCGKSGKSRVRGASWRRRSPRGATKYWEILVTRVGGMASDHIHILPSSLSSQRWRVEPVPAGKENAFTELLLCAGPCQSLCQLDLISSST